jgi:hypothetical protein
VTNPTSHEVSGECCMFVSGGIQRAANGRVSSFCE